MQHLQTRIGAKRKISTIIPAMAIWAALLLPGPASELAAQSLPINFLFRPIARIGYDQVGTQGYLSPEGIRSGQIAVRTTQAQLIYPLSTRIGLFKDPPDIGGSQTVGQFSVARQTYTLQDSSFAYPLRNAEYSTCMINATVMKLKVSLNQGMWLYGARVSVNSDFRGPKSIVPNIIGGAMKFKVRSISTVYMYGLGISASTVSVLPIPVIGIGKVFSKKLSLLAVLPLQVRLQYNISRTFQLSSVSSPLFRSAYFLEQNNEQHKGRVNLSTQGFRTGAQLTVKFTNRWRLFAETGIVPLQRFIAEPGSTTPFRTGDLYTNMSLTYSFRNSLIETKLNFFD